MKLEWNGLIEEGLDDQILIGGVWVAKTLEDEIGFDYGFVRLHYYISDSPIDPDKAVENFLRTFYEGPGEFAGHDMYGSSWTGWYGKKDEISVGGHDIVKELTSHKGKYCHLIIDFKTETT